MAGAVSDPLFWVQVVSALAALIAAGAAVGFFRKEKFVRGELYTTQLERDDMRKRLALAEVRLGRVDPERFLDKADELYDAAKFKELEELALRFTNAQTEAFGRAAEILTEQRILDSGEHGKLSLDDAARFVEIGLAADPESVRLKELRELVRAREATLERGEPLETLNWDGMSDVELNRLSHALYRDGKYRLAEIAARRSVPLAMLRTGRESPNFAGAITQHALCLKFLGEIREAEPLYRMAVQIYRDAGWEEENQYATVLSNLAVLLRAQGRHHEAEPLLLEAVEVDRKTIGETKGAFATRLGQLAELLREMRRFDDAEKLYQKMLKIRESALGSAHKLTQATRLDLEKLRAERSGD